MNPYPVLTHAVAFVCIGFALLYTSVIFTKEFFFFQPIFVMCDVGQGDAFLLRLEGGIDVLIDTGQSDAVLDCLDSHIPFYDRSLEFVIITHPDFDHFGGFTSIIHLYTVGTIFSPAVDRDTAAYVDFKRHVKEKNIPHRFLFQGDYLQFPHVEFTVFWPSAQFISQNVLASETGQRLPVVDANDYSLVFLVETGKKKILFTGDLHEHLLETIAPAIGDITHLKVAHHGARNGLNESILQSLRPETAFISAGKKNRYGHPHSDVIELLKNRRVDLLRTDHGGEFVMKLP